MLTVFEHKTVPIPAGTDSRRLRRPVPFKGMDPAWRIGTVGTTSELTAHYYVGVDWLTDDQTEAISVLPKFQKANKNRSVEIEIDVLGMLSETLKDPGTLENVSDLLYVDFTARPILAPVSRPLLPLFLITAFVGTVKSLTRQGLKKSFTLAEDEMRQKIKGKILWQHSLSIATPARRLTCRYQDFTIDTPENRFLKWALVRSLAILNDQTNAVRDLAPLREAVARQIKAFSSVTKTVMPWDAKLTVTPNPLYKRYSEAIGLARKILHLDIVSPAITTTETSTVPPFWINMPKLFELFVYKKLRDAFGSERVSYQIAVHRQHPDFILHDQSAADEKPAVFSPLTGPFVIADAKYKIAYFEGGDLSMDDARQLAGYGRLKPLFQKFAPKTLHNETPFDRLPPPPACLVIHPAVNGLDEILLSEIKPSKAYVAMGLLGIRIPIVDIR